MLVFFATLYIHLWHYATAYLIFPFGGEVETPNFCSMEETFTLMLLLVLIRFLIFLVGQKFVANVFH